MSGHLEHDQYYAWISIMLLKSKLQSDPVFFSNLDRAELKNDNVVWVTPFRWHASVQHLKLVTNILYLPIVVTRQKLSG